MTLLCCDEPVCHGAQDERVRSVVARVLNIFVLTAAIYDTAFNKNTIALAVAGVTVR